MTPTTPLTRTDCEALDRQDPLRALRSQFSIPPRLIYLDGNSLGVLPAAAAARVAQVVQQEWGQGLIRSWNSAGWMNLSQRVGDKIARLVGAAPGELVVADSTSVNLFKVLSAALHIAGVARPEPSGGAGSEAAHSTRRQVIVSERSNFPTDLYIAQSLAQQHGARLELLEAEEIPARLAGARGQDVAVLTLTHVNYRTGRMHDMAGLTARAHAAGALTVWDLAHSAGAVPVDLNGAGADFAVGCGYKYLNGGPGAPAFVWAHRRHVDSAWQPLAGWIGHAAPFEFTPDYVPAPGITRYLCGTPPVLSLAALECGVDTLLAAEPLGGMAALRKKSLSLTRLFAELVQAGCAGHGLRLESPSYDEQRGSQVCLARDEGAYAIVQALIERGVVGDFRAPDVLRFGFTPLYIGHAEVWDAVEHLRQVLDSGIWRDARFQQRQQVT
ncbi:MAG: kynureninase [Betaproteobacteria bacterium]